MSERAPYSRVYWSIIDDPKFIVIYDDDRHLAAWLRLLLIADQAHPASAHLPTNARPASVRALSEVGLIDVTGQRYRVHGLDAERVRRATQLGRGKDPNRTYTGPEREAHRRTGLDETSKDEPSRADASALSASEPDDNDPLDVYWRLSGTFPSGAAKDWLTKLANEFGGKATGNALALEFTTGERGTVLKRTQNRLRFEQDKHERKVVAKAEEREVERRAKLEVAPEQAAEQRRILGELLAGGVKSV